MCMWNQPLIPALIACCKQELMHTVNIRQTALSLKQTASFDDLEERVTLYNWETMKNSRTALTNQTGEEAVLDTLFLIQSFQIVSAFISPCTWTLGNLITIQVRTVLFWIITQRVVVIPYRSFGTTYRSYLQVSRIQRIEFLTPEDGIDGLSERSVLKYQYSLSNNSESAFLMYFAAET